MVTRHSKQIPIPQSGPRGSPLTDLRNIEAPAAVTAAETMLPAGTLTGTPLIVRAIVSCMRFSPREIRLDRNGRTTMQDLVGHQFSCCQRVSDSQPFVSSGKKEPLVVRTGTNQRQIVRRGGAESCPGPDRHEVLQSRHVLLSAL